MGAEDYNRIRGIIFRTYHNADLGPGKANEYLEGYRSRLGPAGYVGLKAELAFYERHGRDFGLTVAGDMGEHADFAGTWSSQACRFDVATTLKFKQWDEYEPFLGQGVGYKIALLKDDTFELVDVLDLGFRRCDCGGYLVPCITLLGQNFNDRGESTWTNDQLLVDVCTGCYEFFERQRYSHSGLFSPSEFADSLSDLDEEQHAQSAVEEHALSTYKYFRREFDDRLMAVAGHEYIMTDPKGGGHWAMRMAFVNQAVAEHLPEEIECSHIL